MRRSEDVNKVCPSADGFDTGRAGSGPLNFAVDDSAGHIAEVAGRGLAPGPIETVSKGAQLSAFVDPDGNRITLIGNFRDKY